ncbi:MAG: ATP-dependent DNA helicase RecG [Clostridiales bacterium]|nr:ATP-dependent DNA helicase RecG [Clostridiales bacterium]
MKLGDSLSSIKGIGEKTEKRYEEMDIHTVGDLLACYPRSYEMYGDIMPIGQCPINERIVIEGFVEGKPVRRKGRRSSYLTCTVKDATGRLELFWFHMPYLEKMLKIGNRYLFLGKVNITKSGKKCMSQPQILKPEDYYNQKNKLIPVYRVVSGLSSRQMQKHIEQALDDVEDLDDYLNASERKRLDVPALAKSVRTIHFPDDKENVSLARKRLVFDELFLFLSEMKKIKESKGKGEKGLLFQSYEKEMDAFVASLPFSLTNGQKKVYEEILADCTKGNTPMNRLIQGDVGSGNTVLAGLALYLAVNYGYQGAIMAPTEVLAKQHYETLCQWMEPYGIKVELLTGSMTAAKKRNACQRIASGESQIIVGTNALIQEKVSYHCLGMIVTDEQHRFGVRQRENLVEKGKKDGLTPHVLVMSATPIPRTLALILYGDLSISVLKERPADRLPIKNCVVGQAYRATAYQFIEKEIKSGHQAYVICPMVEESDSMDVENVVGYRDMLVEKMPEEITVTCLYGSMKAEEKNRIMEQFSNGDIDILVSTTVVEVGINVPNATVMLIENAEHFGLAQLHQLRGRVGRGSAQSYCIFMSGNNSKKTMERLEVLGMSNDGFYIAQQDLRLRGPGDFFGIRQSGDLDFSLADIYQDAPVIELAEGFLEEMPKEQLEKRIRSSSYLSSQFHPIRSNVTL